MLISLRGMASLPCSLASLGGHRFAGLRWEAIPLRLIDWPGRKY
jgi:hypothetical protein